MRKSGSEAPRLVGEGLGRGLWLVSDHHDRELQIPRLVGEGLGRGLWLVSDHHDRELQIPRLVGEGLGRGLPFSSTPRSPIPSQSDRHVSQTTTRVC
jgi:hypothetical protein